MRPRRIVPFFATLLALAGAGAALAASPLKGRHYSGKTGQGRAISFDVSSTGLRIVHPIFYLRTHCFGGGNSYAQTSARSTSTASAVIKHGKFHLRFVERARLKGGVKARASFALRGRFTGHKRATGTVSVTVRYTKGKTTKSTECLSGPVRYRVRA